MSETRIDTKLFVSTAEAVGAVAKELEGCFQEWGKVMQSLRGHWQGDTSDDIKNTVESVQKSANDLVGALNGYKKALNEMAGIYDRTENTVQEASKSLKFDNAMR